MGQGEVAGLLTLRSMSNVEFRMSNLAGPINPKFEIRNPQWEEEHDG